MGMTLAVMRSYVAAIVPSSAYAVPYSQVSSPLLLLRCLQLPYMRLRSRRPPRLSRGQLLRRQRQELHQLRPGQSA